MSNTFHSVCMHAQFKTYAGVYFNSWCCYRSFTLCVFALCCYAFSLLSQGGKMFASLPHQRYNKFLRYNQLFLFSELDSASVYNMGNWQCRLRTEYRHVAMKLNVLASVICQRNHVILAACRHLSLSLISNDSEKKDKFWYMLLWYVMFNVYVAYIQSRSQHRFLLLFVIMIINFKWLAFMWTVDSQSLKLSR